ncbi:MAG: Zn-ribbon domain-containing OB-fold protein [Promethearchaeota archaeon]
MTIRIEKIMWLKCKKCGKLQYPEHTRCLNCKNREFGRVLSSNEGTLITYTILRAPPKEFQDKKSYALGIVEFPFGIKALGQITTQENLKTGMKVEAKYQKICDNLDGKEVFGFVFEPIG